MGDSTDRDISEIPEADSPVRCARCGHALADQVRDRLAAIGVQLRDTPEGTKW